MAAAFVGGVNVNPEQTTTATPRSERSSIKSSAISPLSLISTTASWGTCSEILRSASATVGLGPETTSPVSSRMDTSALATTHVSSTTRTRLPAKCEAVTGLMLVPIFIFHLSRGTNTMSVTTGQQWRCFSQKDDDQLGQGGATV